MSNIRKTQVVDSSRASLREQIPILDINTSAPLIGSLALTLPSRTPYYADGNQWIPFGGGGGGVTSWSAGTTGMTPPIPSVGAVVMGGILNTSHGGTSLDTSTAGNGTLLIGNGAGWTVNNLIAGAGVTIVNGVGTITISAAPVASGVTSFSAGTTGFTPSIATTGAVVLAGILNTANGGTGLNTSTAGNGTLLIGNGAGWTVNNLVAGAGINITNGVGTITIAAVGGGVTSFSAGTTGFTPNVATTGAVVLAGILNTNNGGTGLDTSLAGNGTLLIGNGAGWTVNNLVAGAGINITNGAGTITIAAVGGGVTSFSAGTTGFSPNVATTGAVTLSGILNTNNGGTGLDTSTAGNGTLLVGNGAGWTVNNLTAGAGISITNGAGTISIATIAANNLGASLRKEAAQAIVGTAIVTWDATDLPGPYTVVSQPMANLVGGTDLTVTVSGLYKVTLSFLSSPSGSEGSYAKTILFFRDISAATTFQLGSGDPYNLPNPVGCTIVATVRMDIGDYVYGQVESFLNTTTQATTGCYLTLERIFD